MGKLLIIGASGHGKVVAEIAELSNIWNEIAFLDDDTSKKVGNYNILGTCNQLDEFVDEYTSAFVAIGNNDVRLRFMDKLTSIGYALPKLVHPSSIISKTSVLGCGTVVMAGAVINPDCRIGSGCIINTGSIIDHDCILEKAVHISPGAHLAGTVSISKGSWICLGSNIINNIKVGCHSIIAAGSTVINDVPDNVMVAGSPAIIKKYIIKNL